MYYIYFIMYVREKPLYVVPDLWRRHITPANKASNLAKVDKKKHSFTDSPDLFSIATKKIECRARLPAIGATGRGPNGESTREYALIAAQTRVIQHYSLPLRLVFNMDTEF